MNPARHFYFIASLVLLASSVAAGQSESTFTCDKSTSGVCNYVIFSKVCEGQSREGVSRTVCTFEKIDQFTLKVSESRRMTDLPQEYSHCMDGEKMPIPETCIAK